SHLVLHDGPASAGHIDARRLAVALETLAPLAQYSACLRRRDAAADGLMRVSRKGGRWTTGDGQAGGARGERRPHQGGSRKYQAAVEYSGNGRRVVAWLGCQRIDGGGRTEVCEHQRS